MKEKANNQIYRIDGKNCFVECMTDGMDIGQIVMNFVTYNTSLEKGSRQTNFIPIYLSIPEFLALAENFANGEIARKASLARAALAGKTGFVEPLYCVLGGTSAKKLREQGKARPDGKSLSRKMSIAAGEKYPYLLIAEQGVGETDMMGLIVPKFTAKTAEARVSVPVKEESLQQMFAIAKVYIQAYITRRFMIGEITGNKPESTGRTVRQEPPLPPEPVEHSKKAAAPDKKPAAVYDIPLPEPPPEKGSYRKVS